MKFEVSWEKITAQATTTEPNKYELSVKAIGDKQSIEEYAFHCGDWPPNKEVADRCSLFHPIRGICGAGDPNICGHCGKHRDEHD